MGITPAIVPSLLNTYNDLVNGASTLTGAAAQIAGPAVAEVMCQAGGLASILAGPFGPLQSPGTGNRTLSDMGAILQSACAVPPPLPEAPSPPFTGGQCPCVSYSVQISTTGANPGPFFYTRVGPIGGAVNGVEVPENPGRKSWGFYYGEAACGGRRFELISSSGLETPDTGFSITVDSATRMDGLPDDCGDPPAPVRPPGGLPPIPDLPPSPIIPDDGPGGGGGFIFKPVVGPINITNNGQVTVSVVVNVGGPSLSVPVTIPVTVNLPDFSVEVNVGGSGGDTPVDQPSDPSNPPKPLPPVCCEPVLEPGPIVGEPEDEPAENEPIPPGKKLVGIRVSSSVNPVTAKATRIFQTSPAESLWVPRLGNVYFRVTADDGDGGTVTAETQDSPVKLLSQYFPVPEGAAVSGWRVVPEKGVQVSVLPLYQATNTTNPSEV